MNAKAWFIILLFLGWSAGSWYWYTCKIKGYCYSSASVAAIDVEESTVLEDPVEISKEAPERGPLGFQWDDPNALTGDDWSNKLEGIVADGTEGKELQISGPYGLNENNSSEYENLGLARAASIRALLKGKVDSASIKTSSHIVEGLGTDDGKYFEGAQFTWLTNTDNVKQMADGALIYFPYKSDDKIEDAGIEAYLDELVSILKENDQTVEIIGHTDDKGSAPYNLKLGQERADAVKNTLVAKGIDASRIIANSKGESDPMVPNTSDENKAKNRRTEIKIK